MSASANSNARTTAARTTAARTTARGRRNRTAAAMLLAGLLTALAVASTARGATGLTIDFDGVPVPVGTTDFDTVIISLGPGEELTSAAFQSGSSPAFGLINSCAGLVNESDEVLQCRVDVSFSPEAAGSYSAELELSQTHEDGPVSQDVIHVVATAVRTGTTTTLTSSANPSAVGESVTFMVTVAAASGTAVPAGSVTFADETTAVTTVTLSGGVATFTTSALALGSHSITASYAGSAVHDSSSDTVTQEVLDAPGLLAVLLDDVIDQGPGNSLADKIRKAQAYVEAGDIRKACRALNEFISEVRAQTGKSITASEAAAFIAVAEQIQLAIPC